MNRPTSTTSGQLRVAIALDHPAQHFGEGFALLGKEPDLDIEVMYWDLHERGFSDPSFGLDILWDVDLTSTYPHWTPSHRFTGTRALQCIRRLLDRRPDVILCYGWATPLARLAIAFATLFRIPILYYGDSTWQHSTRPRLRVVRTIVLHMLFARRASGALSTGVFNRDFYVVNGMMPDKVHAGVCPVDTRRFVDAIEQRDSHQQIAEGGERRVVSIAFAGKFVDRKAPSHLIEAVVGLADSPPWHVTMIGDGPLRNQLERLVESRDLGDKVTFSGFKNTSAMPGMLAATDVLVIPSTRDMRILVATEAMAAGAVPVVSSATAVWGTGDLVEHGTTGMVYPVGDIDALRRVLAELITDSDLRARLSVAARERALEHDSDDFARLAAEAFRAATPYASPPFTSTT